MATLESDFRNAVRRILGEPVESFWYNDEIDAWNVESIREVSERVVKDALIADASKYLLIYQIFYSITDNTVPTTSTDILHLVSIRVEESDGEYSNPYDEVSSDIFDRIVREESEQDQDSTTTRIYTHRRSDVAVDTGIQIYPVPVTGRTLRVDYIERPSESGTMTLPNLLHSLVRNRTISLAAAKKSRDLDMSDRFNARYENRLAQINREYFNKFGLSGVKTGYVRDVMG